MYSKLTKEQWLEKTILTTFHHYFAQLSVQRIINQIHVAGVLHGHALRIRYAAIVLYFEENVRHRHLVQPTFLLVRKVKIGHPDLVEILRKVITQSGI